MVFREVLIGKKNHYLYDSDLGSYSERDLNPHRHCCPLDFKSSVSTDSTIRAFMIDIKERKTGFEPATSTLARLRSTNWAIFAIKYCLLSKTVQRYNLFCNWQRKKYFFSKRNWCSYIYLIFIVLYSLLFYYLRKILPIAFRHQLQL